MLVTISVEFLGLNLLFLGCNIKFDVVLGYKTYSEIIKSNTEY